MPSTVAQVFTAAGLEPAGVVRWGERVPEARAGVYVVALSANTEQLKTLPSAPVSLAAVGELLAARPELTLDGARPSARALAEPIASFWLADETIVYIGLAGTSFTAARARLLQDAARRPSPTCRWLVHQVTDEHQ